MGSLGVGQPANFEDADPAAPAGTVNVVFQADAPTPPPTAVVRNISAYMPPMTATVGGAVPTPPNDATKCLDGTGLFSAKGGILLENNGTRNGSQTILNLAAGANVTITDDGSGDVTIAATGTGAGGGSSLFTKTSPVRAFATVYQNTSGQPIIVMGCGAGGSGQFTAYCDSSSSPTTVVNEQLNSVSGGAVVFLFIVPNNDYYKITGTGWSLYTWFEWKINSGTVTFSGELSGSRALSTVYHNTSSHAMLVVADISGIGSSVAVTGISDTSATPSTVIWLSEETTGASHQTVYLMVPAGHYYEITCSGGAVAHWNEYTLPFGATKSLDYAANASVLGQRAFTGDYPTMYTFANNAQKDIFVLASVTMSGSGNIDGAASNSIPPTLQTIRSNSSSGASTALPLLVLTSDYYGFSYNTGTPSFTHWWEYVLG